ncbi:MAG: YigZ family protein [Bacteroidales bacterium]|nr:YigZ family protein [Bacteroidales bacterium]
MENTYKTLAEKAEGLFKEKGSKFLAFGFPVTEETEIKSIISSLRKEYHDARHHCYAYRIGENPQRYRTNDDGEPSGTAGRPIYRQIISHNLTNILIVVIRYFGGTLLGTSGLTNAYRSAAADMISRAKVIHQTIDVKCNLTFPYALLNGILKILKEEAITPVSPVYDNTCTLFIYVPAGFLERFKEKINRFDGLKFVVMNDEKAGNKNKFQP